MNTEVQLDNILASDATQVEKLDAVIDYCIEDIDLHASQAFEKRLEQGEKLLPGLDYPRGEAYITIFRAYSLWGKYELQEMQPYIERATRMFEDQEDPLGLTLALTVGMFRKLAVGDFTGAFEDGVRALKLIEQFNIDSMSFWIYYIMGVTYFDIDDNRNALKYYTKALELFEKVDHSFGIYRTKIGIASCHMGLGNLEEAQPLINDVIDHFTENRDEEALSRAINDLGVLYRMKGDLESAEDELLKAYDIRKTLRNKRGLNTTEIELGELYIDKGDYHKALKHISAAQELSHGNKATPKLTRAYHLAYKAHKALDNIPEAFKALEKYLELHNEVSNSEMNNRMKMQESSFVAEKAEQIAEIERQRNKEIMDSINYAKRIQSAILPSKKLVKKYLPHSFILYKPKDVVAGDFYWIESYDEASDSKERSYAKASDSEGTEDLILFAACDCTGHGVPGAMVSVVCNNGLKRSVREYGLTDPGEILNKTREIVIEQFEKSEDDVKDGMDVALCSLSLSTLTLRFSGGQ